MRNTTVSSSREGTSIAGLLGVAFVILKLTDVISWSWWWVLAPFWGGLALFLVGLLIFGIGMGITLLVSAIGDKRQERRWLKKKNGGSRPGIM